MKFRQAILYYFYPPFDPHIDPEGVTIIQRYVYCQPFKSKEVQYGLTFNVEEKCEVEAPRLIQFFRALYTQTFEIKDLPESMHLSMIALAENEVFGMTAESFVEGLFTDLCVSIPQYKWMERYFPKWERKDNRKVDKAMTELLNIQRRIRNGEFNE